MNNKMRLERLRKLHEVVSLHKGQRGKPVKLNGAFRKWNMETWDCGTAACALGSAALNPWFRKRHLKLTEERCILNGDMMVCPAYGDLHGYGAGAKFFGITHYESFRLFDPTEYLPHRRGQKVTPSMVLSRIESLIKKYEQGRGDAS